MQAALKSDDVFFHFCLYDAMVEMGDASTLLASAAPHLERFLGYV